MYKIYYIVSSIFLFMFFTHCQDGSTEEVYQYAPDIKNDTIDSEESAAVGSLSFSSLSRKDLVDLQGCSCLIQPVDAVSDDTYILGLSQQSTLAKAVIEGKIIEVHKIAEIENKEKGTLSYQHKNDDYRITTRLTFDPNSGDNAQVYSGQVIFHNLQSGKMSRVLVNAKCEC